MKQFYTIVIPSTDKSFSVRFTSVCDMKELAFTMLHRCLSIGARGVLVSSLLALSAIDRGSDRVKPDNEIGICCFAATHETFRRKSKYWFVRNQRKHIRVVRHVYSRAVVSVS